MKKKSRIFLGYIFILSGILLPLLALSFMAYNELFAKTRYEAFKEQEVKIKIDEESYNRKIKESGLNIIDPFENEEYEAKYDIENFDKNQIFAYLLIPKLDLKKPIYLDASKQHLKKGLAQIEGTNLPIGGKSTRSVIAGHRIFWGDLMLYNIDELEAGDKIFVDLGEKKLEYEIFDQEIITPGQWQKILPIEGEDILTLLTCHPKRPPRAKRLLVNAKRVVEKKEEKIKQEENQETKAKEEIKNFAQNKKEEKKTSLKYLVYAGSLLGWFIFILVFIKMIKGLS